LAVVSLVSVGFFAACGGGSGTGSGGAGPGASSTSSTSSTSSSTGPGPGGGDAGTDPTSPPAVRAFADQQVGGLGKPKVPAPDAAIPVPPDDPMRPGRYKTTPAKKYLGKLLFHDPIRTARININTAVPLDLPAGTAFGGTVNAADPNVPAIVLA